MIEFQKPYKLEAAKVYIEDCLINGNTAGDGKYTKACSDWILSHLKAKSVLMTTSCTHALELALYMLDLSENDEVIVPSFTYPSTANAVLMAGGKVVFSQVNPDDFTLDPRRIEEKITENTKAILPMHYGGNICQMEEIMAIAKRYNLRVIEDAAQSFLSTYKETFAGTIGDFGCFSFHGTKDLVAGEGGALLINNGSYKEAAGIFRAKGTNREAFLKGDVDYYEWVGKGSSYSPSELLMALLYSQLEVAHEVVTQRKRIYLEYQKFFESQKYPWLKSYSQVSPNVDVNGHLYYIEFMTEALGDGFRTYMKDQGVMAYSHFVPLHSSAYGRQLACDVGDYNDEQGIGHRLVRLPIYPGLSRQSIDYILSLTEKFMLEVAHGISGHSNL